MANFTALKTAINNAIKTNGNEEITGAILQAILDAMVETLGDSAINDLENAITTEVTNRENAVGGVADDLAAEVQARQALDYNVNNRINAEEYNRQNADAALSQTMSQGFQTLGSQMTALNAAISALNAAYQNGYLYGGIATPSSSPSNNKCFYIALQGGTYTNFGGVGVVEGINIIKNDSGWKVEHIYDQTTLLNEFYLLRQQVIQAITSFTPIVIEGDVTNAPDEEDLTSNANHLLQFKNNAYSPLEFSGLGRKYLRKNIAPLSESAPFNGFVEGVTAEETLSGTPTQIFWDRIRTRFVGIKDGIYYAAWTDDDNYIPVSTSLVYMYKGTPYQWTGSDFIVDETEVPNLVNCLTQDMINEANTIYIIRYDYTLKENITIPANCVLQFDGGSISGDHTITGANTGIQAGLVKIFSTDVTLDGTWNVAEAYPEWFGAKGDGVTDDLIAIQKCFDFGITLNKDIILKNNYLVSSTIYINKTFEILTPNTISGNGIITINNTNTIIKSSNFATSSVFFKGITFQCNGGIAVDCERQKLIRSKFDNCIFKDCSSAIVGAGILQDIRIIECEFYRCSDVAIKCERVDGISPYDVTISKSKFKSSSSGKAIVIGGYNILIDNCIFEENGGAAAGETTDKALIEISYGVDVTLSNNYFEANRTKPISLGNYLYCINIIANSNSNERNIFPFITIKNGVIFENGYKIYVRGNITPYTLIENNSTNGIVTSVCNIEQRVSSTPASNGKLFEPGFGLSFDRFFKITKDIYIHSKFIAANSESVEIFTVNMSRQYYSPFVTMVIQSTMPNVGAIYAKIEYFGTTVISSEGNASLINLVTAEDINNNHNQYKYSLGTYSQDVTVSSYICGRISSVVNV